MAAFGQIRKGLVTPEPIFRLFSKVPFSADNGSRIELTKLNYTTFFPNLEEAQLLTSQLKQLKDYLEMKQFLYMK